MLNKADLRDVSFADIQALRDNQIPESHTLDFKRDFPSDKEGRASLAADVVAFANTRGGDLIIGADETGGCIAGFKPIELADKDEALLTLQSALRDLIEPRIPGIQLHAVSVPSGGWIAIVRTPPSFQAPHRVTRGGAFYTRTSTGIDPMDITTLRSAFLRSETAIERIREFREDRVTNMWMKPLQAPLAPVALGVLHVVPLASMLGGMAFDVHQLYPVAQQLPPPTHEGGRSARVNFDGAMSISAIRDQTFSYTQIFRNGCMESVMQIQWDDSPVAWTGAIEEVLDTEHHAALQTAHRSLGIDGPAAVMLSFADIGGKSLENNNSLTAAISGSVATVPKSYLNLMLPEVVVDSFVTTPASIYGPMIDMVWNAAGRQSRPTQR